MRLTRQLILVSALTLVLPWAGLQFIAEMEASLRDGQTRAMKAGAQAVAKLVASDAHYLALLSLQLSSQKAGALYAHPLLAAPIVDGYDDEWRHFPFTPLVLGEAGKPFSANFQLAYFSGHYYGFLRVTDGAINYHNPSRHAVASGDHVQLLGMDKDGAKTRYRISASAPGKAQVYFEKTPGKYVQEYRIKAFWQERAGGYQLEFQIPEASFGSALGLSVVNKVSSESEAVISTSSGGALSPIVRQFDVLSDVLRVFSETDQRLYLLSLDGWLLADHGQFFGQQLADEDDGQLFDQSSENADMHYQWLWRLFIDQPRFLTYQDPVVVGGLAAHAHEQESDLTLPDASWFQHHNHLVARVLVPILVGSNKVAGFVVIEQATDSDSANSANALWRLLRYSLLSVLVIGFSLLGYASWLSWRVKRLSGAVDKALGEQGAIEQTLPENNSRDELGQLSRSFSSVLAQLHEYTHYLRTLSSKLSHELRTPLAVVKTSLDNLQQETSSAQREIYAQRAQAGAERLSSILNAMSAASRLEESLGQAETESIQLDQFVKELAQAYSDSFGRPIAVDLQTMDCWAEVVPELLVQMLDKLVDNAVDFCPPEGAITLRLSRSSGWIVLTVSNDGPTLPSTMKDQLFDSLVSLREAGVSQKAHLGLGLHIVRLIVEYHRGRITASNRDDGSGVQFDIYLPVN